MITSSISSTHLLSRYFTSPDNEDDLRAGGAVVDQERRHGSDRTRQSMMGNLNIDGNMNAEDGDEDGPITTGVDRGGGGGGGGGGGKRTGFRAARAYLQSTFHSSFHSSSTINPIIPINTNTLQSPDPTLPLSTPTQQHPNNNNNNNTRLININNFTSTSSSSPPPPPTSPRRLRRHSFTPVTRTGAPTAPLNSETSAHLPSSTPVTSLSQPRDEPPNLSQISTIPVYLQTRPPILPTLAQLSTLPPRRHPPAPLSLSTPHPDRSTSGPDSASQETSSPLALTTDQSQSLSPPNDSITTRTLTLPTHTVNPPTRSPTSPRTPRTPRAHRDRAHRRSMTRGRAETAGPVMTSTQTNGNHPSSVNPDLPSIRLTPHHDPRATRPSLNFPAITRTLPNDGAVVKVGRYSERENTLETPGASQTNAPVGFKSKVVSRRHCEFWCVAGQWFIKDVKSSSGTFLNHLRLSPPGVESKPWPINDGDVVQLGIDFRGGEEMIFRCVKIRVECNRSWQKGLNNFNTSTHKRLQNLVKKAPKDSDSASVNSSECSICLMSIAPCQPLFVAPCSHVWHYKCIRPILQGHTYPNFLCPNCRAHADLEADIEDITVEDWEESMEEAMAESRRSIQAERNEQRADNGDHTHGEDEEGDGFSTPRETLDAATGAVRSLSPSQDDSTPEATQHITVTENVPTPKSSATETSRADEEDLRILIGMNRIALQNTTNQISPAPVSAPRPIPAVRASTTPSFATATGIRDRLPEIKDSNSAVSRTISGESSTTVLPASVGSLGALVAEGPMTPRNDAGPFVLDGGASRGD